MHNDSHCSFKTVSCPPGEAVGKWQERPGFTRWIPAVLPCYTPPALPRPQLCVTLFCRQNAVFCINTVIIVIIATFLDFFCFPFSVLYNIVLSEVDLSQVSGNGCNAQAGEILLRRVRLSQLLPDGINKFLFQLRQLLPHLVQNVLFQSVVVETFCWHPVGT